MTFKIGDWLTVTRINRKFFEHTKNDIDETTAYRTLQESPVDPYKNLKSNAIGSGTSSSPHWTEAKHMLFFPMAQSGSISVEVETLNHVLGLIEAFRAFDSDNDGSINAQELGGIMWSLGYNVSKQDVQAMVEKVDTNKDGLLSLSEFLDMNTEDLELGGLSALKTAFETLDPEEHDILTGEELYQVVKNVGILLPLDDCQEIVASKDGDGDGAITVEELKLLANSLV